MMSNIQINNRIKKLIELEAQKKALEKQIEAVKDEIKSDMGDNAECSTDKYTIRNTPVDSERFDSKTFKAEHGDMYRLYVKVTHSTRFSFKEV